MDGGFWLKKRCAAVVPSGRRMKIVVYGCQGAELAFAEPMGAVMMEGQLPVAPLHTGAAALKEVGAFAGDPLDLLARGVIEHCEH